MVSVRIVLRMYVYLCGLSEVGEETLFYRLIQFSHEIKNIM